MRTSGTRHPRHRLARLLAQEDGLTLVELAVALAVMMIGMVGVAMGFDSSRRLSLISERHAALAHVAQREIERIEGIPYANIGMSAAPGPQSSNPANPNSYLSADGTELRWDRTSSATETIDIPNDGTGQIVPVQDWSEGQLGGKVYDYITWTSDPRCGGGCPASRNYKRITVAVTMTTGLRPNPVYVASVIADPQAMPSGGIENGDTGNPLADPATKCLDAGGQTVSCTAGITNGNANAFFLHDWAATNTGTPPAPSASHATHPTVQATDASACVGLANVSGCPVPDLMDADTPAGDTTTPLYQYSTDLATSGYPGGRLLQPTGAGSGSASDCSDGAWSGSLSNAQSQLWVSPPLSQSTTLTGDGGLSLFSQTQDGAAAVESLCLEIYDVPPSGSSGIANILAYPPVALGGAAYVPAVVSGANWPVASSQISFVFRFLATNTTKAIASGHRIGLRLWIKSSTPVALIYDNPATPSQLQLNTQ